MLSNVGGISRILVRKRKSNKKVGTLVGTDRQHTKKSIQRFFSISGIRRLSEEKNL